MTADLEQAIERATLEASIDLPTLDPDTQVIRREGWYQILTPALKEAMANEVIRSHLAHLSDAEIDQRIDETFAMYRKHGLRFKWSIGPMSSPESLEAKLARRAADTWGYQAMTIACDAPIAGDGESLSGSVTVERVTSATLEEYVDANLAAWESRADRGVMETRLRRALNVPQCRAWIARHEGRAIGVAGTVLRDGYGYLLGSAVRPEARGLGAYRALVSARLTELRELGLPFAVTYARDATSAPILIRLGFESRFRARIYQFEP